MDLDAEQCALDAVMAEVRACRLCADVLPLGPRPVLRGRATARILIVGQAPGTKVHESGIPWNDPSGDRLRAWMQLDRDGFYDEARVAIIPMGYCYPGRNARGGDLPPRKECARLWLPRLLEHLPRIELTVLAGSYAQRHFLGERAQKDLTETVRAWRDYAPGCFPLPHPSLRNQRWLRLNSWFEDEVIPALRKRVHEVLAASPRS
ncbi:MAG TPA: uracil-DNA glycosylase family protein [Candidatus Hydrogenedentes bacterium]|nr:uracil-DNA glycosylase family protein [Candidatus Hydrogenedentota bacterium]